MFIYLYFLSADMDLTKYPQIWSIWDVMFKGGQTPYIMSPLQV